MKCVVCECDYPESLIDKDFNPDNREGGEKQVCPLCAFAYFRSRARRNNTRLHGAGFLVGMLTFKRGTRPFVRQILAMEHLTKTKQRNPVYEITQDHVSFGLS